MSAVTQTALDWHTHWLTYRQMLDQYSTDTWLTVGWHQLCIGQHTWPILGQCINWVLVDGVDWGYWSTLDLACSTLSVVGDEQKRGLASCFFCIRPQYYYYHYQYQYHYHYYYCYYYYYNINNNDDNNNNNNNNNTILTSLSNCTFPLFRRLF